MRWYVFCVLFHICFMNLLFCDNVMFLTMHSQGIMYFKLFCDCLCFVVAALAARSEVADLVTLINYVNFEFVIVPFVTLFKSSPESFQLIIYFK